MHNVLTARQQVRNSTVEPLNNGHSLVSPLASPFTNWQKVWQLSSCCSGMQLSTHCGYPIRHIALSAHSWKITVATHQVLLVSLWPFLGSSLGLPLPLLHYIWGGGEEAATIIRFPGTNRFTHTHFPVTCLTHSSNSGKLVSIKAMTRREAVNITSRMARLTLVLPGPGTAELACCCCGLMPEEVAMVIGPPVRMS